MTGLFEEISSAAAAIRGHWKLTPAFGVILGTGLGDFASLVRIDATIPYSEIPHFPSPSVESHAGRFLCGRLGETPIVLMEGRVHYYEGCSMRQVTFPVRVMKALGVRGLMVTNAAGGLNPSYKLGDIVLLDDHINLLPDNPLRGPNDERLGPRFPDLFEPYDRRLLAAAEKTAAELGIRCHRGVMVAVSGPNLETRAEYRMLRAMGADVVGMSTVPEVLVAVHAGLRTVAISVVTDLCYPDALAPVRFETILQFAAEGGAHLKRLIPALLERVCGDGTFE